MLETIQELIYPPKCGICGKLDEEYLCKICRQKLEKEAIWEIQENQNPQNNYNERMAIFPYSKIIRKYILQYKFGEKAYLYQTFTNFIIKNQKVFQKIQKYDMIIPVPISKKRKQERGYNQSTLIAREIAQKANIKIITNALYKIKHTIEQSKLNQEQRKQNAKNVYAIQKQETLKNKKILLIDDIYTTGITANKCCEVLKQAEPQKIGVLVLARD